MTLLGSVMANNTGLINNLVWKFAERITAQLVTTIVSIVLARILDPSHYGIIAMVTIFITIANVFVTDGLGSALIQKHNPDSLDYSSVLYFNILVSIILYFLLFFLAPFISKFYGEGYEILTPVLRVLSIRLILCAINSVQQAYVAKHMIFKKFFWATLTGTVLSAVVGVLLAINGFGVWALVAQYLTNTTVDTVFLGFSLKKKPLLKFSIGRVKELFDFGIRILGTSLLITGYQEIRALIIGKVYSSDDLAFYEKGRQFPNLIITNINVSITAVLFPKMANEQDDKIRIKTITRNSIRFCSFIMCPMMLGLAAVSNNFVSLLLTEKWLPCVPLLQLFCLVYLFQPIHSANMQAIKAMGESGMYLKLEIIKKVIEIIVLISTICINVQTMVIGMACCTTLFTLINAYPNIKLINYSIKEQMIDIIPSIGISLFMAFIVWVIGFISLPLFPLLIIQIIVGFIIYFGIAFLTKNKELSFIISRLKNKKVLK